MRHPIKRFNPLLYTNIYWNTVLLLLVSFFFIGLTRPIFYLFNQELIGDIDPSRWLIITLTGARFDLSAVVWLNLPFLAMRLFPFSPALSRKWIVAADIYYFIINSLAILLNLADCALFRYVGARMRFDSLAGWLSEGNVSGILISYLPSCWGIFLLAAIIITLFIWTARRFRIKGGLIKGKTPLATGILRFWVLAVAAIFAVFASRGVIKGHPLKIGDAIEACADMRQVPLAQSTPFCIIRTIGKGTDEIKVLEFFSESELAALRSSVHNGIKPAPAVSRTRRKNIFVIVMESGGAVWGDQTNVYPQGRPQGLMPFLDSIASHSLRVRHIFAAGKGTIDGMTTIFGGFPAVSPFMFMTSPYARNRIDAPARLLREDGYSTKFYLGSEPGSCNIDQFLKLSGFSTVTSVNDYPGGDDRDKAWGIFDHAVASYAAHDLSSLPQPFFAGWLTLNPHMPFNVPSHWNASGYKSEEGTALRAAEYVDRSLRNFFEAASREPWYKNTIFIITSDHGTRDLKGTPHDTPWIQPHIFFIAYAPDGSLPQLEISDRVMSQHDIAPTLLGLAGYNKPYIALGTNVFSRNRYAPYAISMIGGGIQVYGLRYMIMLPPDLSHTEAVYDIVSDPTASKPLSLYDKAETERMVSWTRAFMQDYTTRLTGGKLSLNPGRTDGLLK